MLRHGGFVLEPNVLLLRPINHLLLSRPFSAIKLPGNTNDLHAPKNESLNIGSLNNGSLDNGSLKVESALLAATASSPLLSNLLDLASNSTEESYAKHLEEEIERMEGGVVISDTEVAVNVEEEGGLKAEEAASGETVLAGIIQAVWQFNSSTGSVLT